jgi:WD40 repeat protein
LYLKGDLDESAVIQRTTPPSRLTWHPKKKILITCWEGGEITIYNDNTKRLEIAPNYHQHTVNSFAWSSNGNRLITGDKVGNVIVWKFDSNGKLNQQTLNKFNINEQVMTIIVKPTHHIDHEK